MDPALEFLKAAKANAAKRKATARPAPAKPKSKAKPKKEGGPNWIKLSDQMTTAITFALERKGMEVDDWVPHWPRLVELKASDLDWEGVARRQIASWAAGEADNPVYLRKKEDRAPRGKRKAAEKTGETPVAKKGPATTSPLGAEAMEEDKNAAAKAGPSDMWTVTVKASDEFKGKDTTDVLDNLLIDVQDEVDADIKGVVTAPEKGGAGVYLVGSEEHANAIAAGITGETAGVVFTATTAAAKREGTTLRGAIGVKLQRFTLHIPFEVKMADNNLVESFYKRNKLSEVGRVKYVGRDTKKEKEQVDTKPERHLLFLGDPAIMHKLVTIQAVESAKYKGSLARSCYKAGVGMVRGTYNMAQATQFCKIHLKSKGGEEKMDE